MAKRQLPDPETLRKLLRYDPETGKLYWLPRPIEMFQPTKTRSQEGSCAAWNRRFAGKQALIYQHPSGHMYGKVLEVHISAHRVIWCLVYGYWPNVIDHINRQPSDNRLCNLRDGSHKDNCRNFPVRRDNKWGRVGICWNEKHPRWWARITVDGKTFSLGFFKSFDAACKARDLAERKHGFHPNHGKALAGERRTVTQATVQEPQVDSNP
jgi:hypothetical protein